MRQDIRRLDTPENRAYWASVKAAVDEWRVSRPAWARELEPDPVHEETPQGDPMAYMQHKRSCRLHACIVEHCEFCGPCTCGLDQAKQEARREDFQRLNLKRVEAAEAENKEAKSLIAQYVKTGDESALALADCSQTTLTLRSALERARNRWRGNSCPICGAAQDDPHTEACDAARAPARPIPLRGRSPRTHTADTASRTSSDPARRSDR